MRPGLKVGVSGCLMGQAVRYDGGHKHSQLCTGHLSRHLNLLPLCPEVDAGLPVPRPPMQLRRIGAKWQLVTRDNLRDHTASLQQWMNNNMHVTEALSGFVLKARSPSCGLETGRYDHEGRALPISGPGLFADWLAKELPLIPRIDEEQLLDVDLQGAFVEQVCFMADWQAAMSESPTLEKLTTFHGQHKYQLQAHCESVMRRLGQMLANPKTSLGALMMSYIEIAMRSIGAPISRGSHQNILLHLAGFFRDCLSAEDRQRLHESIAAYVHDEAPLSTPIQQLRLLQDTHRIQYLENQSYLLSPWVVTSTQSEAASHSFVERFA